MADLLRRNVDVIVTASTPATEVARKATSKIPIVMATVGDPIGSGFVASLARPGGNITGLSLDNADISPKWFEFARMVAPQASIGILSDPKQPPARGHVKNIENAAQKIGVKVPVVYASTADEIEGAFASLTRQRVRTVVVLPGGAIHTHAERIAQIALKRNMISIATTRDYAEVGFLLSYGQDYTEVLRQSAAYVDKIFKGKKPSELPIEQPTVFELVINLKTAKQLGLDVPKELLLRANRIIE